MCTVSKRVLILRTWSLIRTFLAFWVLIYISGSLFSLFWFHSRKECQFSLHVYELRIYKGLHATKFLLEGSPSSRQETRSCIEFSKCQQNNSYTYFISVSKNIASSRLSSQLCQGPVVYTSADFVLSTFTCMLVSSGKRVFDGGQGSSSSGTNDKRRRMGAN